MSDKEAVLTTRTPGIRTQVLALAWPVILEGFTDVFMFIADAAMLGRVGKEALAVSGIAGPIMWLLPSIFVFPLTTATMATVARAWGEKDRIKQEQNVATALAFGFGMGIFLSIVGIFLLPFIPLLYAPKGEARILAISQRYVMITGAGLGFMIVANVCAGILRATGNTKTPMIVGMFVNLLNVFVNYLLIFGNWGFPRLEAIGAATGTFIALLVYAVIMLSIVCSRVSPIPFGIKTFGLIIWQSITRFLKVAIPAMFEPMVRNFGYLIYFKVVAMLGALSLAAHRVGISAESISFMPGWGFAIACGALVGQSLGERNPAKAVKVIGEAARMGTYVMAVAAIMFLLFSKDIVGFFAPGELGIIGLGTICLMISAFEQPFLGLAMIYSGALKGAGDTRSPVFVSLIGTYFVRIPLSYILAIVFKMGLVGVWITMIFDWGIQALLLFIILKAGRWKTIKL